jgi:hypothetical protein
MVDHNPQPRVPLTEDGHVLEVPGEHRDKVERDPGTFQQAEARA